MNLTEYKNVIKQNNCAGGAMNTLYAIGPAGSGKSSAVNQAFSELGMNFYADLRLGMIDSVELGGMQIPVPSERRTINTLPSYFPTEDDAYGIIHLDEFDHGTPSTQSAAYQLVLDRRIGDFILPENVSVIMSSNRKKDGGVHFSVPKPTKNRVIQILVQTDLPEFLRYATKERINSIIIGFIRTHPEYLYHDGNRLLGDGFNELGAFASPRSWFTSNDVLNYDLDEYILEELLIGTIGSGPTEALLKYITEAGTTLDPDDILKGELGGINRADTRNISSMYYNLDIVEQQLIDNPSELKKTQHGLLEFMNIIEDVTLKVAWWKTLNDLSARMLKPTVKEKEADALRLKIMQSTKGYM